jgi:hypothetical protein
MTGDERMVTAYAAALQALAANAVRGLLAAEADDPEVGAVMVECTRDGMVGVTLISRSGAPIGGYSL